jgi:hypothetical protein
MLLVFSALIVAGIVAWACLQIARELKATRDQAARGRALQILTAFVPAVGAAHADPRALLLWQPLARTARQLFPDEFAALDRASGATFPFSDEIVQAAHARWTADWLAWEGTHDAEFKVKAATLEHELGASGGSPIVRARLDAVEREKLDRYQRRYEEYIRVSKALQAVMPEPFRDARSK